VNPTSAEIAARLRQRADTSRIAGLQRFFKTGPGEYAEGDVFIGVTVPLLRQVCECRDAAIPAIVPLLESAVHEERLLALLLVEAFKRGAEEKKREI
jgi:DNA alkylation repair enzyme